MTEIRFYHLQRQSQDGVLPVLLERALERGHRIVVKAQDEAQVAHLSAYLWTYRADSFLPHGSSQDGNPQIQPVWLTYEDENPNGADVLILAQGVVSGMQGDFTLCCEMLDGHDENAVRDARSRWKTYKDQGFDLTYWQQNERGVWEKKA